MKCLASRTPFKAIRAVEDSALARSACTLSCRQTGAAEVVFALFDDDYAKDGRLT